MPIVFAQPEPLAPSISQGAGAADQWSRDFPTLERQQTSIADNYIQAARIAAQHSGQVYQAAAAGQQQQAAMQAQANAQGSQQLHQSQMLAQQQSGQAGLQQQHADLQQQLASTALSQQETMHLQRLRNGLGMINQQVQAGDISEEDGRNLATQLVAQVNPLQLRQAKAQQQQMELQRRLMEQHVAQNDRMEHERATYQNQNAQDHVSIETDGNGVDHSFSRDQQGRRTYLGHRGGPSAVWQPGQPVTGSGQQGGGEGGTGNRSGGGGQTGYDHRTHAAALEEARAIAGLDENGKQKPVTAEQIAAAEDRILARNTPRERGADIAAITSRVWQEINSNPELSGLPIELRRQMRDQKVAAEVARVNAPREEQQARTREEERVRGIATRNAAMIHLPDLGVRGVTEVARTSAIRSHVDQAMAAWDARRETERAAANPQARANDMNAATGRNAQQTPPVQPQPFPMTNDNGPLPEGREPGPDRERMNPAQREIQDRLDLARRRVAEFAPADRRSTFNYAIDRLERLRHEYGTDPAAIPPDLQGQFNRYVDTVRRIPTSHEAARAAQRRPVRTPIPTLSRLFPVWQQQPTNTNVDPEAIAAEPGFGQ